MKKRLGVFFGGRSPESDISVLTAMQVFSAIDFARYDVVPVYLSGEWYTGRSLLDISAFRPFEPGRHEKVGLIGRELYRVGKGKCKKITELDCALIVCHGGEGENGALQGLFEVNGLPYVSSGVEGASICMNKARFKQIISALRYKTAPHVSARREEFYSGRAGVVSKMIKKLGFPLVVKPASLGSSIGVTRVTNRAELEDALTFSFALDDEVVVEREIVNKTELNCSAFRSGKNVYVSAVERPIFEGEILSFEDKYLGGGKEESRRELPAKISSDVSEKIRSTTMKLYRDLGLSGVVRVDYMLEEDGELLVNEVNTVPGSLAFYLYSPCGIEFTSLIDMLVEEAEGRFRREVRSYAEFCGGKVLEGAILK